MPLGIISSVFVGACISLTLAATPYRTCSSPKGSVSNVVVAGCSSPPCILKRGSSVIIEVDFTPSEDVAKPKAELFGVIGKIPVRFAFQQPDACKRSGLTCPLKSGQRYVYTASNPINTSYPAIQLIVKWTLKDSNGGIIFCVEIPAEIQ